MCIQYTTSFAVEIVIENNSKSKTKKGALGWEELQQMKNDGHFHIVE